LSAEEQQKPEAEESAREQTEAAPAAEAKPARRRRASSGTSAARAPRSGGGPARAPRAASRDGEAAGDGAAAPAPGKRVKRRVEARTLPRLQARYREEIKGQLLREFGYSSPMQVPQVSKVVVNVGLGEALTNARAMETTPLHVGIISGQKPVITKARRSIAGFKLREGQAIGVMVTLRGRRMYEFLDRMISMALPRIRDFRGVSRTAFDGNGNYSLGLREQIMFPEIDYSTVDKVRGLQVTITTTAQNDPEGLRLLELMGMPFAREGQRR
jgi:large subunit ribosomal protein L5